MPLIRIDAVQGRNKEEIRSLLDAVHRAVVGAFHVPIRDRYQIYQEYPEHNLIAEDTGLGIRRTKNILVITVTSRPRSSEAKQSLYAVLCEELEKSYGISKEDVIVSIVTNTDEDWSFGLGRAQFLDGDLS